MTDPVDPFEPEPQTPESDGTSAQEPASDANPVEPIPVTEEEVVADSTSASDQPNESAAAEPVSAAARPDAAEPQDLSAPAAPVQESPDWATTTQRLDADHVPTTHIPPIAQTPTSQGNPVAEKKKKNRFARNVAAVTGIVLLSGISGVTGAAVFHASNNETLPITNTALDNPSQSVLAESSVEKVAAAVLPSTVKINVAGRGSAGQGTGIVISEDGTIITNNHVIEAAADGGQITVVFQDGTNAAARIVGRDVGTDVAVIEAEGVSGLKPATLGSSSNLQVGQSVVAIGSPFGLEATVTDGIISALNRPVSPGDQVSRDTPQTIFPGIQTDAAINPGNSGGPLVDMAGRVIGINSAISTGDGSSSGSIGLGFAIPINLVSSVSEQILAGKKVEHARIGVIVERAQADDNLTGIGAKIGEVAAGSAGDQAGLKAGDIITGVDGHPVASQDGLVATVRGYRPGDTVTLTILRDGTSQDVELTLGSDRER